jgi:SNF2 family DNA or RNA helicase
LPIPAGEIADDCGTGKTITMLTVILQQSRTARRDFEAGATGPWKPTIIICPPHVVDVWFDEVTKFFSSELQVHRFYETKAKVTYPIFKAQTLPSTAEGLVEWLDENYKEDDPRTAGKIVVTAYDTWACRTLMKKAGGSTTVKPVPDVLFQAVDDDLDEIPDDEAPGSNELDPSMEYYSPLTGKFRRVVLDKAHKVRNPQTKTAESIRQLMPKPAVNASKEELLAQVILHLLTATPIMNRGSDLYGYLTLL